jgi:hypothetical protein
MVMVMAARVRGNLAWKSRAARPVADSITNVWDESKRSRRCTLQPIHQHVSD